MAASRNSILLLLLVAACGEKEPELKDQSNEPTVEPSAPATETTPMRSATAPVYVGLWAADKGWCEEAPGSNDTSPIALTETEFLGYENRCRIASSQEGTEGGYQLTLICMAEGVEYQETIDLDVDGEMMRLRRGEAGETVFTRCTREDG